MEIKQAVPEHVMDPEHVKVVKCSTPVYKGR